MKKDPGKSIMRWLSEAPLTINGTAVESIKFLGMHIADDLKWSTNTSAVTKKAQKRLYFLRRLKKSELTPLYYDIVLQRNHREHSHIWYHCLVGELYWSWPQDPTEDCESSRENHWCLTPTDIRHIHWLVCQEGHYHNDWPLQPTYLHSCHLAGGSKV